MNEKLRIILKCLFIFPIFYWTTTFQIWLLPQITEHLETIITSDIKLSVILLICSLGILLSEVFLLGWAFELWRENG